MTAGSRRRPVTKRRNRLRSSLEKFPRTSQRYLILWSSLRISSSMTDTAALIDITTQSRQNYKLQEWYSFEVTNAVIIECRAREILTTFTSSVQTTHTHTQAADRSNCWRGNGTLYTATKYIVRYPVIINVTSS